MTDSLLKQCGDAIVYTIQQLTLVTSGGSFETNEVRLRKVSFQNGWKPERGITVSPVAEREAPGTNVRDDYGYGFLLIMCQGTGHGIADDIDRVSLWRQQIKKAFNNKRLTGASGRVSEVYICTFESGAPFMPKEYQNSHDVGSFVVRCWAREART